MRCVFKKVIRVGIGTSTSDVYLHRVVELPFPILCIGMEVSEGDWVTFVDELVWHDGTLYSIEEVKTNRALSDEEMSSRINEAKSEGWHVSDGLLSP